MVREALLALLVVALTFLNFGHTSAVFAAGGRVVVTGTSVCGDQSPTGAGDHFACHACRSDAAVLPPPPCEAAPIRFTVTPVAYAAQLPPAEIAPVRLAGNPRAPPAI
jgi:hypothetical protein